jgi:hypothetical protein
MGFSLLDKKRFIALDAQRRQWLQGLSLKKSLKIEECLLSSALIWELRRNFFKDRPLDLRRLLMRKHGEIF